MPSFVTPKKNTAYEFWVSLVSQADTKIFQAAPTLAAGDAKVSIDGGAEANLATLPSVSPAGSKRVKVNLSAAEMNGDNIQVTFSDAAGGEWCDLTVNLQTTARQVDDLAYPTTSGRSIDVAATGEVGVDLGNVTGVLGNANVGWVDANDRIDVGSWLGTAVATPTVAGVPEVDVTHMEGGTQTVTDLKDFADAGYDPATNKVEGVKLVDTTTTNTDMRGTDNAALASVLGALADAAAAGDPTATDTVMQYVKQLVNVLVGTAGVATFPAEAAPANAVSLAEVIRAIHADVTGLNGDAMRGTDNAALASVLGALTDAAAAGDPTATDTVMQYMKQLVNVLVGTSGVATYPAAAVPANAVSLSEVLRQVYDEVAGLDGAAMRGTDNAALASVATEARLAELDAANLPADVDQIKADLPQKITKNVQLDNFEFVMIDSSDNVTPKTGLTITATRSIDGGAFAACTNAAAEVANGVYKITLADADTNGDVITYRFTAPGALDRLVTVVTQQT